MRDRLTTQESPVYKLLVDGTELKRDYTRLITGIHVHGTFDGATDLTIGFNGIDPETMDYAVMDQRLMLPGREVQLWLGYGAASYQVGRFVIQTMTPHFGRDGARYELKAVDRLADLMRNKQAELVNGVLTNTEAIGRFIEERYPWLGYLLSPGTTKAGDRFKRMGDSDLLWLKYMALADGFAYPRIMTREQWALLQKKVSERVDGNPVAVLSALALSKVRDHMLVYAPLSDLYSLSDRYTFHCGPRGECDLDTFDPTFSADGIPVAVEVYGWTRFLGARKLVKVIVEYGESGPTLVDITDEWEQDAWARQQKIRPEIKSGGHLKLYTLSEQERANVTGGQTTVTGLGGKPMKVAAERLDREIMNGDGDLIATDEDVVTFAKRWFLKRAASYLQASFGMSNLPGSESVWPNQVHGFVGMPAMYAGLYAIKTVDHHIDESGGHTVRGTCQKLVEEKDLGGGATGAPLSTVQEVTT